MCLQYRHATDTVYAFSLSSLEEENVRSKFSAAKKKTKKEKWSHKEISICNKLLCMAKCNLSLCAVFKWNLMFIGKKLWKKWEKKTKMWGKMRNGSRERAHFKKNVWCLSQYETLCFRLTRNGKAGVLWYLMVLRPFFKKLFSLRGGGHYLPCGFRSSSFPLSFQSLVLVMGFTFFPSWLWWFLKCPFEKGHCFSRRFIWLYLLN